MSTSFFIFIGSFCGILTAFVGGQRGYGLGIMYVLGFLTGPIGIAVAYLLPNKLKDEMEAEPAVKAHQKAARAAA